MSKFYHSWTNPNATLQLVIEDNRKVAYAYLYQNREIVADVWLYNQAPTPTTPKWEARANRNKMPFLNPSKYCFQPTDFTPLLQVDDVSFEWLENGIIIYFRGLLFASLLIGQKPGASLFAIKNGPLAKVLNPPTRKGRPLTSQPIW